MRSLNKNDFDFKAFEDLIKIIQEDQECKEKLEIVNDELTYRLKDYDYLKGQEKLDKERLYLEIEDFRRYVEKCNL
jgi:hypothetical protein